jgi:uncharacterized membrane protein YidH (DUF202 family)
MPLDVNDFLNTAPKISNQPGKAVTIDIGMLTSMIATAIDDQQNDEKKQKKQKKEQQVAKEGETDSKHRMYLSEGGAASPKDHMANERTMMKWMRMVLFLALFGTVLVGENASGSFRSVGMAMLGYSILCVPYATYTYWVRQGMLERKENGGADKAGIYVFVLFTLALMMASLLSATLSPASQGLRGANPEVIANA